MWLVSACEPFKQSKLLILFPPLHLDAVVLAPEIYVQFLPFSFISCHVKPNAPFSVAPALVVSCLYVFICLRDNDAVDCILALHCASETWCEAFLWLCQWSNPHPYSAIHHEALLMAMKMKQPSLSSLSLIRLLTLSLRHPGREILLLWLLLFPSSEIYFDRKALTE